MLALLMAAAAGGVDVHVDHPPPPLAAEPCATWEGELCEGGAPRRSCAADWCPRLLGLYDLSAWRGDYVEPLPTATAEATTAHPLALEQAGTARTATPARLVPRPGWHQAHATPDRKAARKRAQAARRAQRRSRR
jgi:hypothetical protein